MMTFCVTIILMSGGGKTDKKITETAPPADTAKPALYSQWKRAQNSLIKTINACAGIKKKSTNKWIFRMMLLWLVVDDMMVGGVFLSGNAKWQNIFY